MARTVAEINSYLVSNVVTQMATVGITIDPTLWSKRNILRCIIYAVAIGQALVEQLQDEFMTNVEEVVATAAAASATWVQAKMFEFQFSSTDPQVVALVNTIPVYPVIDPSLRIITACSVTKTLTGFVTIKAAKGNPFEALASDELSSAQGYINSIGVEGINYTVQSLGPDRIYIDADIWFQGQYAAVISNLLSTSIQKFLQDQAVLNFNGKIKMSDLEEAIRETDGVNDVTLKNVRGRAAVDLFSAGIDLILDTNILQRQWSTIAGYSITEDTAGKTLTDSLNLIAE